VLGHQIDGATRRYVRVPAGQRLCAPANLSWEEVRAFPLTFSPLAHARRAPRQPAQRETVLVIGATARRRGGDPARRLRGCRVIATAGSAEKVELARKLGADDVIDHYARKGEIHKAVYEVTGGQGVDVVVEHVGPAVFEQCVKALKRGGAGDLRLDQRAGDHAQPARAVART